MLADGTRETFPNGNMADAHAEIGALQQAHEAGVSKGADINMVVSGKDVCGYCRGE
ncbi:cytidine deaminase-like fold-containing protein, partial [Yersinia enterocolitica]